MIKKLLIANRGEIAVRIIKTCRNMDISPIVVFSEADREGLHVLLADEAYCIGPPAPSESYLNIGAIIEAAKRAKADAIHPGYGFLSENPEFAKACQEEGLIFVGPGADVISLMGCKTEARDLLVQHGMPVIPGVTIEGDDVKSRMKEINAIGFPLLIKASYGGGGKGMRIVKKAAELESSVETARREAGASFKKDAVYIEKYIENARHIEFQILCDEYGNILHLFERECSVQRRHQKIVEETPSTALDEKLRFSMGETAREICRVSNYTNAGTIEFILDEKGVFYFLEMNTRIQVEHPVTELTTGIDLIARQLLIASHGKLDVTQGELSSRGHAIECRIYAEDPANNFFPSAGKILYLKEPCGPGIRNDCGVYSGGTVSIYYDPMISKLIAFGDDREMARKRMLSALKDYIILGIKTNIPFLLALLEHEAFIDGKTHTDFIPSCFPDWTPKIPGNITDGLISIGIWEALHKKEEVTKNSDERHDVLSYIGAFEIGK